MRTLFWKIKQVFYFLICGDSSSQIAPVNFAVISDLNIHFSRDNDLCLLSLSSQPCITPSSHSSPTFCWLHYSCELPSSSALYGFGKLVWQWLYLTWWLDSHFLWFLFHWSTSLQQCSMVCLFTWLWQPPTIINYSKGYFYFSQNR